LEILWVDLGVLEVRYVVRKGIVLMLQLLHVYRHVLKAAFQVLDVQQLLLVMLWSQHIRGLIGIRR
jgi:hypothetical protein